MKIGDNVYVHGYVDEIRKETVIIRNEGGYFGTVPSEIVCGQIPAVEAIPIEWLKKHSWYGVIEHWEKDQKLNNSKEVLYSLLEDHGFNSYKEYIDWAGAIMAIPRDDRLKFLEMERKNEENDSQAD